MLRLRTLPEVEGKTLASTQDDSTTPSMNTFRATVVVTSLHQSSGGKPGSGQARTWTDLEL